MADGYRYAGGLTDADFTSGPSGTGYQPHNFAYGAKINIDVEGTITSMGVRCTSASGTPTVKVEIFDSSGNLVGTGGTFTNNTTPAWRDTGTLSISVSAGDHYVLVSSSDTNSQWYYNTGGNGLGESVAYASFPPASISTTEDEASTRFGVRLYLVEDTAVPQYARPNADVTDGGWYSNTGTQTDLYSFMDETPAADTDFIETDISTTGQWTMSPVTSVGAGTYILRYRAAGDASSNLIASIGVGTPAGSFSLVQSFTETGVPTAVTAFAHTVTGTFSDTTKLSIKFEAT